MVISSFQRVGAQILSAALILTGATTAFAAPALPPPSDEPAIMIPEKYIKGRGPAGMGAPIETPETVATLSEQKKKALAEPERPQAVLGSLYTVIGPVFRGDPGSGNNTSYIRFGHAQATASTLLITVVGSPSGRVYGTTNLTLPPLAIPQYSYSDILDAANADDLNGGDDNLFFYVRKTTPSHAWGFQHVIFNNDNLFFENVGVCTWDSSYEYSAINRVLPHIHTSLVGGYPSQVFIHNYYNANLTFQMVLTNVNTGEVVGNKSFILGPNATVFAPMSYFEEQFGINVAALQVYQVNAYFAPVSTTGYYLLPAHMMLNISDLLPVMPSIMERICSCFAPRWGGLRTQSV